LHLFFSKEFAMSHRIAIDISLQQDRLAAIRPLPLAMGMMVATLAVVVFACLQSDVSSVRAQTILEGFADLLLVGTGGVLAGAWPWIVARFYKSHLEAALDSHRVTAAA
jgi:hypothetical protein